MGSTTMMLSFFPALGPWLIGAAWNVVFPPDTYVIGSFWLFTFLLNVPSRGDISGSPRYSKPHYASVCPSSHLPPGRHLLNNLSVFLVASKQGLNQAVLQNLAEPLFPRFYAAFGRVGGHRFQREEHITRGLPCPCSDTALNL